MFLKIVKIKTNTGTYLPVLPRLLMPLKYKCLSNRGSGGRCL